MANPLLTSSELPCFSSIKAEEIEAALEEKLNNNRLAIQDLLDTIERPDWDNLIAPLEQLSDELNNFWSPISHLNAVKNSDELRDAYNNSLPKLTEYATELGQNKALYQAYKSIAESEVYQNLSQAQKKLLENELRDFRLSGIDLPAEQQARYKAIKNRLAELSSQFSDNVLDATQGWSKHITELAELAGLPPTAINTAEQLAKSKSLEGWLVTLDMPSYLPVMQFCDNEKLREELYLAYVSRASDRGPGAGQWDNGSLMEEILALRAEAAKLLGFANYAERSLATKMAPETQQVVDFLNDLARDSKPVAEQEFAELGQFARDNYDKQQINVWDVPYYSEKLREQKYQLSQEELKPYFPAEKVITGMFAVVEKLYGISVNAKEEFDSYHPDVKFFEIISQGELIAKFYLDIYARDKKRGGAWMADCRVRRRLVDGSIQLPVAFLTCNFTPPTDTQPSLLTHQEVTTLFHEFGHGLHHMLTRIDVGGVSGINGVEWDAVELPSQFMENWCWQQQAIPLISGHFESGEPLPVDLLEKLLAAKNFQSGMQMVRQLEFSLFDFLLHQQAEPLDSSAIQELLNQVRSKLAVIPALAENRFQHSFSHVFAGGYAAGYYSYKWAEVLSADAFSVFEEKGVFDKESGEKFLTEILEKGGSEDALALFVNYRGREPKVDALLRHCGISPNSH